MKRSVQHFASLVILVVILLSQGIACSPSTMTSSSSDAETYYDRAVVYHSQREYDRAIANFDQAIALDPQLIRAYHSRGDTYAETGDYDRAIADYNRAIELDPRASGPYHDRGKAYAAIGDYDRAIADYDRIIEKNPQYAAIYNDRGWVYYEKDDYDRAIADYDQAIELDSEYVLAYARRGLVYFDKGDQDRAIVEFNLAIELDPQRAESYLGRGGAYAIIGEREKTISDLQMALDLGLDPIAKQQVEAFLEEYQSAVTPTSTTGIITGMILAADGESLINALGQELGIVVLICPSDDIDAECLHEDQMDMGHSALISSICSPDDTSTNCLLHFGKSAALVEEDGSYTLANVPPGQYELLLVAYSSGLAITIQLVNVDPVRAGEITEHNYVTK